MTSAAETFVIESVDPSTGELLERYKPYDGRQIEETLSRVSQAQREWATHDIAARADVLRSVAACLRSNIAEASALITAEMGKTLVEARAEIEKSAWTCEHYAAWAERYLASESVETEWEETYVQFPPLGVVLAIMPWNYPIWQVMRAAAPILMGGNTVALKHASNVSGCALLLERLLAEATDDRGLLGALLVRGSSVAPIIGDPRISAITLTGSEEVGIQVAQTCAQHLKKSVLELGGSDPFIILPDADIASAAIVGAKARFQNAGQSCIAAKRFIIAEEVADEFEDRFIAAASSVSVGDPRDPATDMGPMSRADLRDFLRTQVARGVDAGGRLVTGGEYAPGRSAYYPPTVVTGVELGNPLLIEETFGPVAVMSRTTSERDAIALSNASPYGLSASIWTTDIDRAKRLAKHLQFGSVFVNAMSASDPRMPLGGVKRSGWGRELGKYGIREFVNTQAVTIAPNRAA